jgi:putative oxidoreductase
MENLMIKKLFCRTSPENSFSNEVTITVLRVVVGLLMASLHGLGKVPPSERFIGGVEGMGFPMPVVFAWLAGLSELIGGVFLAIGLFTRPSAFLLLITMLVAAFGKHMADPLDVKELSLMYAAVSLIFVTKGAGRLSIDHFLGRK